MILTRLEGVLEATHARPRLIIAAHPTGRSGDAFWVVGGRVVDWGPVPGTLEELEQRTRAALARGGRAGELGAHVPPHEVDEVRIVAAYLASHPDLRQLVLEPPPPGDVLGAFAQPANGSSTTSALTASSPTSTDEPGGASRRTRASAIEPRRGEMQALPTRPTTRPSSLTSSPPLTGAEHLSPRR